MDSNPTAQPNARSWLRRRSERWHQCPFPGESRESIEERLRLSYTLDWRLARSPMAGFPWSGAPVERQRQETTR